VRITEGLGVRDNSESLKLNHTNVGSYGKLSQPGKSSRTEGRVGRDASRYVSLSGNERLDILRYKMGGKGEGEEDEWIGWMSGNLIC